jgi:hypothetical protein
MPDPENERSGRGFGFNPRFYGRRFHHVELEMLLEEVGDPAPDAGGEEECPNLM